MFGDSMVVSSFRPSTHKFRLALQYNGSQSIKIPGMHMELISSLLLVSNGVSFKCQSPQFTPYQQLFFFIDSAGKSERSLHSGK